MRRPFSACSKGNRRGLHAGKVNYGLNSYLKQYNLHSSEDLPSYVRRTADFLNKPLSDELINRIAQQCSFKGMKKNEISYKSYFTPELNERFEKEVLGKIKGTGLEFDFEAY